MVTLLFGGYDTTSIALSCALYLLATHPEVERECLGEIMSVMGTTKASDDSISGPDALPYTRAVICEALRMYPPAPLTARHLEKPMEIRPGVVLPEGASIFVPIWSIQRCARNFPRCDRIAGSDNAEMASGKIDQLSNIEQLRQNYRRSIQPSDHTDLIFSKGEPVRVHQLVFSIF